MNDHEDLQFGVDANGCPTEQITVGGQTVVVHYDDVPKSDITSVHGMRCTTAVRTVIDLAVDLGPAELETVMKDCLDRGLFTVDEMASRLSKPDMKGRRGAALVRELIERNPGGPDIRALSAAAGVAHLVAPIMHIMSVDGWRAGRHPGLGARLLLETRSERTTSARSPDRLRSAGSAVRVLGLRGVSPGRHGDALHQPAAAALVCRRGTLR